MKAKKAPDRIYIHPTLDNLYGICERSCDNEIEYVRTDVFIEKACKGIDHLLSGYIIRNFHFGDSYDIDRLIEDFRNYMKEE